MAIDYRAGTKVIKNLRREDANATRVDPYPYIGIVKNNFDPTRSGRLQVWIPDLGGDEEDQLNWRTVSYSSPYMGYTSSELSSKDTINRNNAFDSVSHTYGMWMVPPDIGVHVIVLFIAGDPLRGYWISCVNPNLSHHMLPGLAGSTNVDFSTASDSDNATAVRGLPIPTAEFNENVTENVTNPSFYNLSKPIHTIQYNILKNQGLDRDPIRGAISSSSQRETPSHVFGISTPGRPVKDPADPKNNYIEKLNAGTLGDEYEKVKTRKGGHTFVMDDGATLGENQLVRLRTANGHQILMHDSNNNMYISHADGTSWVELTGDGQVKIYSKGSFSVRSEGSINLHSDASVNIQAENNINLKAGNKLQLENAKTTLRTGQLTVDSSGKIEHKSGSAYNVESNAGLSLKATGTMAINAGTLLQNSGGAQGVNPVPELKLNQFGDTVRENGLWVNKSKLLRSIVTVAPCHEPYNRNEKVVFFSSENAGVTPQATYTGSYDAVKNTAGAEIKTPANTTDIRKQPDALGTIGNLDENQVKAYMAQIGKSESGGDYSAENELGYVGKYQMGYQALVDQGYVKSTVTSNAQLDNPNSWTGKDGIANKTNFLSNPSVQEQAMHNYTKSNYTSMLANGSITSDMPPEDVGGMLATSHLLGATGAKNWRQTGTGKDANGTTGIDYFQKGKYAVAVMAPQVPAIDAG